MSDEEKKALERLNIYKEKIKDELYPTIDFEEEKAIGVVLNLIEKQSKEIEHQIEKRENQKKELAILNAKQIEFNKLVNTVNSYKGQFKRQEKEIEELKEIYQTGYVNGCVSKVYEINKKWKDKIKAMLENEIINISGFECVAKGDVQSLLEKE